MVNIYKYSKYHNIVTIYKLKKTKQTNNKQISFTWLSCESTLVKSRQWRRFLHPDWKPLRELAYHSSAGKLLQVASTAPE